MVWYKEPRGEAPLSVHSPNAPCYYQHDLPLMMLMLKTWLRGCPPDFSILKLLSSPPPTLCLCPTLWKRVTDQTHISVGGNARESSYTNPKYKSFAIFPSEPSFSPTTLYRSWLPSFLTVVAHHAQQLKNPILNYFPVFPKVPTYVRIKCDNQ